MRLRVVLIVFLWFLNWYVVVNTWNGWCCRWCVKIQLLQVRTVAATDNLAQASLSRLGEVSRGSPRPSRVNGRPGDLLNFEQASVSLKRGESRQSENVQRPLFQIHELSPRRRELAWARVSLAWARPFSLSEELGEDTFWVGFLFVLGWLACDWLGYCIMAW